MKIGVFPGSFDPITIGHESVIKRALPLFDKIIVAIGNNSNKKYHFSIEKRMEMIEQAFKDEQKIEVKIFQGLTVDFCKKNNAQFIIRGLRSSTDFDFERPIAQMNKALNEHIDTVFLLTDPEMSAISSTIVRDIIVNGGDVSQFIPKNTKI
jgi:pantetheine-phosphate adenylyltransferase